MKRYKLIKRFEGIPADIIVGTIVVMEKDHYVRINGLHDSRYPLPSNSIPQLGFSQTSIEKCPEFWEEISPITIEKRTEQTNLSNVFKRLEGFYPAKYRGNWIVVKFENEMWWMCGVKNCISETRIEKIGERIEMQD